jgi:predicted esterase
LLVGFHGYGENAEAQFERLRAIPQSGRWLVVSVQALHRFYDRRTDRVVASWMTRQDRELAIADNVAYVAKCIDAVAAEWKVLPEVVFAGFSQGAAMAFRAAVHAGPRVAGVIAVGGDVPPELTCPDLQRISAVLMGRGTTDTFYPQKKFADDERRLRECSTEVRLLEFDGGHEWPNAVTEEASRFLRERFPDSENGAGYFA